MIDLIEIAVCDDEKVIREQIADLVEQQGADCRTELFATGDELLAVKRHYDMIFLDIQMEGRNGIETARAIRKYDEQAVIVFVTAVKEYVFELVHRKEPSMKSLFEQMGGTYRVEGDYLLPNLIPPDTDSRPIGKYGRMRLNYLKEHHRTLYTRSRNMPSSLTAPSKNTPVWRNRRRRLTPVN